MSLLALSSIWSETQAEAWEVSKRLADHLKACGIVPAEHPPVAEALVGLVGARLAPLAKALYPRGVAGPSVLDEEVLPSALFSLPPPPHLPHLHPITSRTMPPFEDTKLQ